jgi:hypothetical protein
MKLKWKKKRCSRCERLKLVDEFRGRDMICVSCREREVYPVGLILQQVLLCGSKERVAKALEIDLEIVERICKGEID